MADGDPHLVVAAGASNEPEAAVIVGLLKGAGIKAMTKPGTAGGGLGTSATPVRQSPNRRGVAMRSFVASDTISGWG